MKAIVNGKLYDTEKAEHTTSICLNDAVFEIYITSKGNMFAVETVRDIVFDSEELRRMLEGKKKTVNAYIKLFGTPEEA